MNKQNFNLRNNNNAWLHNCWHVTTHVANEFSTAINWISKSGFWWGLHVWLFLRDTSGHKPSLDGYSLEVSNHPRGVSVRTALLKPLIRCLLSGRKPRVESRGLQLPPVTLWVRLSPPSMSLFAGFLAPPLSHSLLALLVYPRTLFGWRLFGLPGLWSILSVVVQSSALPISRITSVPSFIFFFFGQNNALKSMDDT